MRFVAGRDAVAKRLVRGAAVEERHRENVAGQAPWQKGKPPQREGRGKKVVASKNKPAAASKKKPAGASKRKLAGASKKKARRPSRQLEAAGAGGD